ncbi:MULTISPECIES: DUF3710 domain-containing protein [unclassified Pseudoclavibacter]|uniref:DUF3710 domain-containing protein n=1 Tax=unclassified Pseudoclavibacter TaxID=2615177 RepID=UPI001300F297|nr:MULTISPECIES: DUF3710 domain-containing protein [unclassified Pseudoclavibacter]KAB1646299.1 DUF3710 domain-containing protein [Pseudoclavibacter sp. CFCC 14310]KAB1663539.1 DUF3710 domain-containing protein [Pseudoclavibacter sp. CFCC 13611]
MFGRKSRADRHDDQQNADAVDTEDAVRESDEDQSADVADESSDVSDADELAEPKELLEGRDEQGPFDFGEFTASQPLIDFGSILLPPRPGLTIRVEVEEPSKRPVAVTFEDEGTQLQVQAFAAPRSEGLWHEVREQITQQLGAQKAAHREFQGELGLEVHAAVQTPEGTQVVRFLGVDGPRWFLRGVVSGTGLDNEETAERVNALFRSIVVRRGSEPRAPRELLPLSLPQQNAADSVPANA